MSIYSDIRFLQRKIYPKKYKKRDSLVANLQGIKRQVTSNVSRLLASNTAGLAANVTRVGKDKADTEERGKAAMAKMRAMRGWGRLAASSNIWKPDGNSKTEKPKHKKTRVKKPTKHSMKDELRSLNEGRLLFDQLQRLLSQKKRLLDRPREFEMAVLHSESSREPTSQSLPLKHKSFNFDPIENRVEQLQPNTAETALRRILSYEDAYDLAKYAKMLDIQTERQQNRQEETAKLEFRAEGWAGQSDSSEEDTEQLKNDDAGNQRLDTLRETPELSEAIDINSETLHETEQKKHKPKGPKAPPEGGKKRRPRPKTHEGIPKRNAAQFQRKLQRTPLGHEPAVTLPAVEEETPGSGHVAKPKSALLPKLKLRTSVSARVTRSAVLDPITIRPKKQRTARTDRRQQRDARLYTGRPATERPFAPLTTMRSFATEPDLPPPPRSPSPRMSPLLVTSLHCHRDALRLQAVLSAQTNTDHVLVALGALRRHDERLDIANYWRDELYRGDLIAQLIEFLSPHYHSLVQAFFTPMDRYYARRLQQLLIGQIEREAIREIVEIFALHCGTTNAEIAAAFGQSGYELTTLLRDIFAAEPIVVDILLQLLRTDSDDRFQLVAVCESMRLLLDSVVINQTSATGLAVDAAEALLECTYAPNAFYASRLHDNLAADSAPLLVTFATRAADFPAIRRDYLARYDRTLEDDIHEYYTNDARYVLVDILRVWEDERLRSRVGRYFDTQKHIVDSLDAAVPVGGDWRPQHEWHERMEIARQRRELVGGKEEVVAVSAEDTQRTQRRTNKPLSDALLNKIENRIKVKSQQKSLTADYLLKLLSRYSMNERQKMLDHGGIPIVMEETLARLDDPNLWYFIANRAQMGAAVCHENINIPLRIAIVLAQFTSTDNRNLQVQHRLVYGSDLRHDVQRLDISTAEKTLLLRLLDDPQRKDEFSDETITAEATRLYVNNSDPGTVNDDVLAEVLATTNASHIQAVNEKYRALCGYTLHQAIDHSSSLPTVAINDTLHPLLRFYLQPESFWPSHLLSLLQSSLANDIRYATCLLMLLDRDVINQIDTAICNTTDFSKTTWNSVLQHVLT